MSKTKVSLILASLLFTVNLSAVEELDSFSVVSSTIDDKTITKEKSVSSVSVITEEDVQKMDPQNVAELLNQIPGVTTSLTGTDSFKVHIRGIDNQMYMGEKPGVAVIIDGVPVQETTGKINVDLDNIASIKVIKGSASYLYGNDAIAGAIIITTKRPKGENFTNAEAEIGSFKTKRFLIGTNQNFENSLLQLQGSYRNTDGYWDDAFVMQKGFNGKYQYFLNDNSDLTLGWDYTRRETGDGNSVSGITEAQTNPTSEGYYSYGGYYNSDLIKGFLTYTTVFEDDSELMLRVHKYIDDKDYKLYRTNYDMFEKWDQSGAKGEYKNRFGSLQAMIGFDLQKNTTDEEKYDAEVMAGGTESLRGSSDGDLLAEFETKEQIIALYSELNYEPIDNLITTFNARYDNIKHNYKDKLDSSNNVNPSYNTVSYRLGLSYKINENLGVYSNFSTGFRAPSVTQISENQSLLASNPTYDIPSSIDVETTYNYELGIRGKNGIFNYDASIFQIDRKDYIGKIAGSYISSDDEEESGYDNVGDMRSRGLELSLSTDSKKDISFDLAYTLLDAKFTDYWISQQTSLDPDGYGPLTATYDRVDLSGNYVSRTPKHTINLTLNYRATDKWSISPEVVYKGSYYADEANAFKQNGYTVVNLRTNYKVNDKLELFGKVDNLFDKDYFLFVNVNSSALATMEDATIRVAPPRAFYAGLRYKF